MERSTSTTDGAFSSFAGVTISLLVVVGTLAGVAGASVASTTDGDVAAAKTMPVADSTVPVPGTGLERGPSAVTPESNASGTTGTAKTGELSLAVVDQSFDPVGAIELEIVNANNGSVVKTVTLDSDGTWGPETMPVGTYKARISEPDWKTKVTEVVTVGSNESKTIDVIGKRPGRLSVEVEDTSGDPVDGVDVAIVNESNGSVASRVTTGSNGRSRSLRMPVGNYTARITTPGWKTSTETVSLESNESATIDVVGEWQTGRLSLTVRDSGGDPLGGVTVEIVNLENGSVVRTVTTAPDGTWTNTMPASIYTARITEPGWTSFATRVKLGPKEAKEITVTAESTVSKLEGTVTDAGGNPLPDAVVEVVNTSNGSVVATLPVAANGSWGEVRLPKGSYEVVATSNGYAPARRTVTVTNGTTGIALSLTPALTATITSTNGPVATGETLSVTVAVENTASSKASGTVVLEVGGTRRDATTLTLSPGESRTIDLEWQPGKGDAGSYTVTVDTGADTATTPVLVKAASGLSVDISSTNAPVAPGKPLSVDVRVENTGGVEVTETVALVVGGTERDSRQVTLGPGESKTLTLTWSDTTAGTYTATVEGASDSDSTSVAVRSPPSLTLEVTGTNGPVSPGEQLQVDVRVENTGGAETTETVTLSVEGTELDSREVTLSGDESRTLTLAGVVEATGSVAVVVSAGEATASTTVTVGGGTATSTATEDGGGVGAPGFGVGGALVALVAVALLARRRG